MTRAINPAFFLGSALLFCAVWLLTRPFEPAFIELDTATLERFAGRYEARGDFTIDLILKDGKLFIQGPGIAPFELRPTSQTGFYLKGMGVDVAFDVARDGTVRGFSADTEFGLIRMKRVR